jgi:hypothetical protein
MAIMQPLVNAASQASMEGNVNKTRIEDARSIIGLSSHSRCKIVEGVLSDSE